MKKFKLIAATLVFLLMVGAAEGSIDFMGANTLNESFIPGEQGKNKPQPGKGGKKTEPQKGQQDKKQNPVKIQDKGQQGQKQQPGKTQDKEQKGNQGGQKDHGKMNHDKMDHGKDKGNAVKHMESPVGGKRNGVKFNPKGPKYNFKHPYQYGNPGKWYAYGGSGFYVAKNYGQYRSAMARNKHREFIPVYEYQVLGAINIILERNVYLINQMDLKIIYLRGLLIERRDAGLITVIVYEDYMDRIIILERQRASLELSLNVYI